MSYFMLKNEASLRCTCSTIQERSRRVDRIPEGMSERQNGVTLFLRLNHIIDLFVSSDSFDLTNTKVWVHIQMIILLLRFY